MTDRHNLIAFLSLIAAIVILSAIGARTGKPADLAIMTGLIGVLGTFRPKSNGTEPAGTPADPVNVKDVKP